MEVARPIIVLVQTQMGENIGMCARAMLNCGLSRLRLVNPRDGWPSDVARAVSADADSVIDGAECFETVAEAVADCQRVYATTARVRDSEIPAMSVGRVVNEIHDISHGDAAQQTAILFGPEAAGLKNDALGLADRLIHYPVNPEFRSLNLAQAVLLFSWEWWTALQERDEVETAGREDGMVSPPAEKKQLEFFFERLFGELDDTGFFITEQKRGPTVANLRAFFQRATPSQQELNLIHGVITALLRHEDDDDEEE